MGNVQKKPSLSATNSQKVELLLDILSTKKVLFEEGISEYALISQLKSPPYQLFNENALREPLALFNTHFILFHTLYLLRNLWREASVGELDIHTTRIVLLPLKGVIKGKSGGNFNTLESSEPLAAYYLNWSNLASTNEDEVESLLSSFWQKMTGAITQIESKEALASYHAILNLDDGMPVPLATLKRHYRKQLSTVHPDKGGSHEQAQQVILAYQSLVAYYGL
ncbi:DNA-J related domain-containing protein [Alteromonas sp. 1_MG-2023]|uniref:DNA-J related domain-containing protein n=1 Tax=Alteromonas sp. 1_MG-2023 TaxID=3062669 RepID=UPI0026E1885E|nr:DNA-J related domain-containing protein [Alteromonas sp. 1_MG-2023]MDO6566610.1 DNA-J related domain-containing protein [Alteromonas sp. 1_MG-2023]